MAQEEDPTLLGIFYDEEDYIDDDRTKDDVPNNDQFHSDMDTNIDYV